MDMTLDLTNFQSKEAEGSRYVLTSPRSLEACARMHVRPIQLLHKPLEDFIEENPGKPLPLLQVFYDEHEMKRAELLRKCKEVRKTIMMENKIESKKSKENQEKIEPEKRNLENQNRSKNTSINSQIAPSRSRTLPRRNNPRQAKEKLTMSKSMGDKSSYEDINNNTEAVYEVIPNNFGENAPKIINKPKLAPRKTGLEVPRPSQVQATFTKSRSKSETLQESDQPYMISTPKLPAKFTPMSKRSIERGRRSLRSTENDEEIVTSRSTRSLASNRSLQQQQRKRSKSVDISRKPRKSSEIELASSLKFTNCNFTNGYSTPQMQRDQKIVEIMKEKRKQQEMDGKRRYKKMQEWNEEKRMEEKKKLKEDSDKRRGLAQSHLEWEKRIKDNEERRVREQMRKEEEKQQILEEVEKQIERKREEQERLQHILVEEKKKTSLQRKQQQMASRESVELGVLAFQEATEREVQERLEKAQRKKLEKELKEIGKVQLMNKSQRERFLHLQKEVKRRREREEEERKNSLQEKMEKAEFLHIKKVEERERILKLQAKEEEERIHQTKSKQEKLIKETNDYHRSIAEHKKELLKRANTTALQNIQTKSKRAQQKREESQEDHRRKLKQIEEEDDMILQQKKENLACKDQRSKTHQQLKETAIQLSRANARASEVARLEIKKKDETFLESQKQAMLASSIGRGVRSGMGNSSSVKFG